VPASTVRNCIAYAKANPGSDHMAVFRHRHLEHVSGECVQDMTCVNMFHALSRLGAELTDLLGGHRSGDVRQ